MPLMVYLMACTYAYVCAYVCVCLWWPSGGHGWSGLALFPFFNYVCLVAGVVPGLCYATKTGLKYSYKICPRINIMLTRDEFALCLALLLLHRNKAGQSQAEPQKQEKNPGKGEKGGISFLFLCKQREEIMKGCIISFVAKIRRNKSQSKKSL